MNRLRYILVFLILVLPILAQAQDSDDFDSNIETGDKWVKWGPSSSSGFGLIGRLGYTIGGTSPLPIPAQIRKIETFSPTGGLSIGVEAYKFFTRRWGLRLGFTVANQGFRTKAKVKGYYTKITTTDGNEQMGWYTGNNQTEIDSWTMTFPLTAVFRISPRWTVAAGPYLLVYLSKDFDATVSDGYMRFDEGGSPGQYNEPVPVGVSLGGDMRRCGAGVQLCFDWKVMRHIGAFGKLDWGVTSIFPEGYKTVSFKMFPIYGTVGAFYTF